MFELLEILERDMPLVAEGLAEVLTKETAEFLRWAVCENLTHISLSRN